MAEQVLRKIAVDPGFGGFKVAEVQGDEVVVDTIPAVIGIGQTSAKPLTTGLGRKNSRTKPFVIAFDGISYLVGPNVHLYTRPEETMATITLKINGVETEIPLIAAKWADERQWCKYALTGDSAGPTKCGMRFARTEDEPTWCGLNSETELSPCVFDEPGEAVIWGKIRRNRGERKINAPAS